MEKFNDFMKYQIDEVMMTEEESEWLQKTCPFFTETTMGVDYMANLIKSDPQAVPDIKKSVVQGSTTTSKSTNQAVSGYNPPSNRPSRKFLPVTTSAPPETCFRCTQITSKRRMRRKPTLFALWVI